ncbi:MAG: phage integrase SAM-like domain-containing protein [Bacteroidales bacterium]|nr:phage integrase SAM-like domain-containing protein [Bacteroidales bacterium]
MKKNRFQIEIERWIDNSGHKKPVRQNVLNAIKEMGRIPLFKQVTKDWHNQFVMYLEEKNLCTNTIGKLTKELKTFMGYTFYKGIHKNFDYRKFSKHQELVNHPYLDEDEIDRVKNVQGLSESQENVRKIFTMMCYCGVRFSDMMKLSSTNIIKGCLKYRVGKRNNTIPAHEYIVNNIGSF